MLPGPPGKQRCKHSSVLEEDAVELGDKDTSEGRTFRPRRRRWTVELSGDAWDSGSRTCAGVETPAVRRKRRGRWDACGRLAFQAREAPRGSEPGRGWEDAETGPCWLRGQRSGCHPGRGGQRPGGGARAPAGRRGTCSVNSWHIQKAPNSEGTGEHSILVTSCGSYLSHTAHTAHTCTRTQRAHTVAHTPVRGLLVPFHGRMTSRVAEPDLSSPRI